MRVCSDLLVHAALLHPDNSHGKYSAASDFKTIGTFDLHSPNSARYMAPSPCLIFVSPLLCICLRDHTNHFLFLLQMAMALIDFNTLLDCLQSPDSLPGEMLTSQEGSALGTSALHCHSTLLTCSASPSYI